MSYHADAFNPRKYKHLVSSTAMCIKRNLPGNILKDCIVVGRGLSGVTIGLPVAHRLGRPYLWVRKSEHSSHGDVLETIDLCSRNEKSYLIVDDFVGTGETVLAIVNSMKGIKRYTLSPPPDLIAVFLYNRLPDAESVYKFNITKKTSLNIPVYCALGYGLPK